MIGTGMWECMKCFIFFSWDGFHQKAVYMMAEGKKIEKPICGADKPSRCPECGCKEIEPAGT